MRKIACCVMSAFALFLAACEPRADEAEEAAEIPAAETPVPSAPATPASAEPVIAAVVKGEGTGSAIQGQAQVFPAADASGGFRLSVDLTNMPEGAHDWHIHQGACGAANAPVVVPITPDQDKPGITTPLTATQNGSVSSEVEVPANLLTIDQLRSGDYSLHVHAKSGATDHGPTIACADLKS